VIFGDGPELEAVHAAVARHGAQDYIDTPGFVDEDTVQDTLARATCLLMPSTREGYGMIVIEAAAKGVPSVLVAAEDNASTEHIEEGVNGFVVADLSPAALAGGVVAAYEGGAALRDATADWFAAHARELSVAHSIDRVLERYRAAGR
jgi:glycosyltransferase involved in cell wall biosynthesis